MSEIDFLDGILSRLWGIFAAYPDIKGIRNSGLKARVSDGFAKRSVKVD